MNEQTIILNTKVDSLSFIDITVLRTFIPITSLKNAFAISIERNDDNITINDCIIKNL